MPRAQCKPGTVDRFHSVLRASNNFTHRKYYSIMYAPPSITVQRKHAHKTPPPEPNPTTACQTKQINCFQVLFLISICYCSLPLSSTGTCQQTSGNCRQRLKEIYSEELNMEKNELHLSAFCRLGRQEQMEDRVTTSFGPGHCTSIFILVLTDVWEFLWIYGLMRKKRVQHSPSGCMHAWDATAKPFPTQTDPPGPGVPQLLLPWSTWRE